MLFCSGTEFYVRRSFYGDKVEKKTFWKAVHYFSDEWPINFWNSEMNNLTDDLETIKNDGFNSIILVIPWREFQPEMDPIAYNSYALEALDRIMVEANNLNLGVFIRLGYIWDYYQNDEYSSSDRFYQLMGRDGNARKAWLAYAEYLYNFLSKYNNFVGGFITWEDFWSTSYLPGENIDADEHLKKAEERGYHNYLEKNIR